MQCTAYRSAMLEWLRSCLLDDLSLSEMPQSLEPRRDFAFLALQDDEVLINDSITAQLLGLFSSSDCDFRH